MDSKKYIGMDVHKESISIGQNRSRSIKWAEKQEKVQPKEMCFFLTSPFIELTRISGTALVTFAVGGTLMSLLLERQMALASLRRKVWIWEQYSEQF
jgi:hypothetical protein